MESTAGLQLDPQLVEALSKHAARIVAGQLNDPGSRPVALPSDLAAMRLRVGGPLPEDGEDPARVLSDIESLIAPYGVRNAHPRFFGYVGASAVPVAVLADGIAAALNANVVTSRSRPAAVAVELEVLGWLRVMLGMATDGGGLLTAGGTDANLLALAAARAARFPRVREEGMSAMATRPVIYCSRDAHLCHQKIAELMGFGASSLRRIEMDARRRLDPRALLAAIAADRAAGRAPFALIATAGTALTGAVDPIAELAPICEREGLWLHVDACYGGFARLGSAALSPETARHLDALGRADSVAADAHKFLFMPLEAGAVFVRDAAHLHAAFSSSADYLAGGEHDFFKIGLATSRGFRALKIWAALRAHGAPAFATAVERCLRLARLLHEAVEAAPDFEPAASAPELSAVSFRWMPPGETDPAAIDRRNAGLVARLHAGGSSFVSETMLDGRPVIRACIVNFRTGAADVARFLADAREAANRDD